MVRGQWANLARMPRVTPLLFSKDILGFPQDEHPLLASLAPLLATTFYQVSHPGTDQAQPCLASEIAKKLMLLRNKTHYMNTANLKS